jgi:hypothetical protein
MLARGAGAGIPRIKGDGMAIASECRTRPIMANAFRLLDALDALSADDPFLFRPTR